MQGEQAEESPDGKLPRGSWNWAAIEIAELSAQHENCISPHLACKTRVTPKRNVLELVELKATTQDGARKDQSVDNEWSSETMWRSPS